MLRKWVSQYWDIFRDVLVHLASIDYIFYISLQIFMIGEDSFKEKILLINFLLYLLFLLNWHRLIDGSLPDHSLIAPWSLPDLPPVWRSCAVEIIPCLRGCKLETSFKYSLSWYRYLFSEWNCSLNIHPTGLATPNRQTFCLRCGVQRDLFVYIPPHKVKTWFLCFWQNNGLLQGPSWK